MEKNSDRDLLLISVFTFLTVVLWIFFELVKTVKTTTVSTRTTQLIAPFAPTIDTDILKLIGQRRSY
ncbi:hypothetical protein HY948_02835 [Candidatus Gottesmanbacteria bacterium]|nr:hypothetical protein [Candidatus Gottesmanbacteria bacterium]